MSIDQSTVKLSVSEDLMSVQVSWEDANNCPESLDLEYNVTIYDLSKKGANRYVTSQVIKRSDSAMRLSKQYFDVEIQSPRKLEVFLFCC